MITRSTIRGLAASLATATLLFAATSTADAAFHAPMHGAVQFAPMRVALFAPYRRLDWGGYRYRYTWCYWHPRACSYRR